MKRLKLKDLLSEKMMRVNGGRIGAVNTMKDNPPFAVTDTYGKRMNEQEEGDKPGHFGSGENIEVFGYQTKHFDICKSAVLLFKKITPENSNKLAQVYAAKAAKFLDIVFGIEKDVDENLKIAAMQADCVIWDGMFLDSELTSKRGWGHSSIEQGVNFAEQTACKKFAIAHHAPGRTDQQLRELENNLPSDNLFAAAESMKIVL